MDAPITTKRLTEEMKFFIQIVTIVVAITLGYASLSTKMAVQGQRLDTIEGNHLAHIQNSMGEISADTEELSKRIAALENNVVKILTILEEAEITKK